MKKAIAVLLAALMVISLAACGDKPKESTPAPTEKQTEAPTTTQAPTEAEKVLEDTNHAIWTAHGNYLLVDGTPNNWNGKDSEVYEKSALTAIKLSDVKAINEALYNELAKKDVKFLYTIDVLLGTNDAGWSTQCLKDGKMYLANGSYAIKVAPCTVDVDGTTKVYAEDGWVPDAKTANAESLTPDTLFMPAWQEEKDENGFDWTANPVAIGGSGVYTLVVAQYTNASSPEKAGYGMGLVLKEAKDGIAYEEILVYIPADHTYGIVGGFAASNWGQAGADIEMKADGENTWKGEVALKAGEEFKVRADGEWVKDWGAAEGGNLKAEADGTYIVTITFEGGNGTVSAELKK